MHKALSQYSSWALRALGIALFAWIVAGAEVDKVATMLATVNIRMVAWLPLLTVLMIALRAWRWRLLVGEGAPRMPFARAWAIYSTGIFLGSFTPGRLGDLAKTLYLRREGAITWERAMAATLADRLFDVFLLMALGFWALSRFGFWPAQAWAWGLGALLSGLLFAILYRWLDTGTGLQRKIEQFGPLRFVAGLKAEGFSLVRAAWGRSLGLTVLAYGTFFVQTEFLARSMGLQLSRADVTAAIVLIGLASFLPISVAGFGTREAILALIMMERAVPNSVEAALTYSALFFAFCFLVPSAFGFLCWLRSPIALDDVRSGSV